MEGEPGPAGGDGGADRRVKPERRAPGQSAFPDADDFSRDLGFLAGLKTALGRLRSQRGGALAIHCTSVGTHAAKLATGSRVDQAHTGARRLTEWLRAIGVIVTILDDWEDTQ
jgi:hypothetical protein